MVVARMHPLEHEWHDLLCRVASRPMDVWELPLLCTPRPSWVSDRCSAYGGRRYCVVDKARLLWMAAFMVRGVCAEYLTAEVLELAGNASKDLKVRGTGVRRHSLCFETSCCTKHLTPGAL